MHLHQVADAEKLAVRELVVPAPGGSRLADPAAGLREAELYIRDADRSAEQSFADRAPADVAAALAPLNVEAAHPDTEVQHWQLD